jgi:NADH:ubiquinone oxidoreductase subunit 5 (subunit L)/multisubunit Na+/H+ antiporter MnhA subunit/multisubunit Na+/H+ antiporter MnhB subunit
MTQDVQTALTGAVVALPALVGALALVHPAVARRARTLGVAASAGSLLLIALLLADAAAGVRVAFDWAPQLFVRVAWRLDAATLALAGLIAGVGTLVLQFAGAYFGASEKGSRAIAWLALFEASMLGLVLADELLLLFAFWELTGLCSFFLINTDADERDDCFAGAQQAMVVTVGGALPMLLGFLYLALQTGTGSLSALVAMDLPGSVQSVAFALILPGILAKSAQIPFHFWLPGAMAAPTPISAYLHSATMVKAGLVLLLYLFPICGASVLWTAVLVPLGAATCIWGSYRALGEDDIKLLMAWSTVSQLGLMTITVGLGTDLAVRAAALYLFAHAVFKAGLFLSIGAIDRAAHSRRLSQLGGLGRRAPLLCFVVAVLAGSMAGLPPFAGFLSKELVLKKLMLADPLVHDVAVIGIVLGSIGTVAYTARFFFGCFAGAPRSDSAAAAHAPGWAFLFGPALLGALSLLGGLGAAYTDRWLVEPMSAALLGYPLDAPRLALWHGVNVPLVLSAVILTLGFLAHRFLGGRHLPPAPDWLQGPRLFDAFLAAAQAAGEACNRALAGAQPRVYFAAALGLGLAAALPLSRGLAPALVGSWDPRGGVVLVFLGAGLWLLVGLASRIGRVLALTAVGFSVALLYGFLHAPDLMLTQLLVEVLTTVFFVLALRFLGPPQPAAPSGRGLRGLRLGIAVAAGLATASVASALQALPHDGRLPDYYFRAGPAIAEGDNLVNLLLADFRGLDTLIETLVVLLAALGVVALLVGREIPRDGDR